jgi:two-component system NtrC family sensor kinase
MNDQNPSELQDVQDELAAARARIAELQSQLLHLSKLASLGELVQGIAHEIKTPLGAIHSMGDTLAAAVDKLRRSIGESPEAQSALRAIEDAARVIALGSSRTLELVKRVRKLARDSEDRRQADLHAEIEDTLLLLQHELKSRIQVRKSFGAIPPVVCNAGQIDQVLLNLLLNAIQAIADQGTIAITTFARQGYVHVLIQDDGVGIPAAALPKVFAPGFTTKQAAEGSGIGLSICRGIIEDHQGQIELQSEPGKGTTVTVRLPIPPGQEPATGTP